MVADSKSKGRILVVDDEEEVRNSLVRFFKKKGHQVVAAASGAEAGKLMGEQSFDLVLLDIIMPGFDGLETLSTLKSMNPKARFIMVTSLKDENVFKQAVALGANNYILKPFDFNYLETLVLANLFLKK